MFSVTKFDNNNDADAMCKELFANKPFISKKKEKVKHGKVAKKKKKTLGNAVKIKDEIKNILSSNSTANSTKKIKLKKLKRKQNEDNQRIKTFDARLNTPEGSSEILENKKKRKKKKKQKVKSADVEKTNFEQKIVLRESKAETLNEKQKTKRKTKTLVMQDEPQKDRNQQNEKLKRLNLQLPPPKKRNSRNLSLRERMMAQLQAARFRYLNEQIYSTDSKEAQKIFKEDPEAFTAYHDGYRQQVGKWPLNPVDVIIKSIQKLPKSHVIADFGCGDAKIAQTVSQKVHSFDLVAINDLVTPCDMAHVPLESLSVDVVVFCLSLMGTNLHDYLLEANRILKLGGTLKIAEVESRFDDVNQFIEALKRFNFKNTWKDFSHNLFYFLDFKKEANIKNKKKLPTVSLNPCLYKKR